MKGLFETLAETSKTLTSLASTLEEQQNQLSEREQVVSKRERALEESFQRCEGLKDTDLVTFNVGGQHYMYTVDQIEAYPESVFACLISERWNKRTQDQPRIYNIARSARLFKYFDDFLRLGTTQVDPDDLEQVKEEQKYYGLELIETRKSDLEWIGTNGKCCGTVFRLNDTDRCLGSIKCETGVFSWKVQVTGNYIIGITRHHNALPCCEYGLSNQDESLNTIPYDNHDMSRFNGIVTFTLDMDNHCFTMTTSNWKHIFVIKPGIYTPYAYTSDPNAKIELIQG